MSTVVKRKRRSVVTSPVTVPAAILHLLDEEGESYGQMLLDRLTERTKNKFRPRYGSIYPALRHLEQDKLISVVKRSSVEESGPPKKRYRITEKGRKRAAENKKLMCHVFGIRSAA